MFSDQNGMKLETKNVRNSTKHADMGAEQHVPKTHAVYHRKHETGNRSISEHVTPKRTKTWNTAKTF